MTDRSHAYEEIRRRALEFVEEAHVEAEGERVAVRNMVARAVDEYQRRSNLGESRAISDPTHMVERIVRSIADFGPLTELLARTDIEEIFIEGPRVTFIDGTGRLRGLGDPTTLDENPQVIDRLLCEDGPSARRIQPDRPGPGARWHRPADRGDPTDRRPVVGHDPPLRPPQGEPVLPGRTRLAHGRSGRLPVGGDADQLEHHDLGSTRCRKDLAALGDAQRRSLGIIVCGVAKRCVSSTSRWCTARSTRLGPRASTGRARSPSAIW